MGFNLRRGSLSHCSFFSSDSSCLWDLTDQSFHAESSSRPRAVQSSAGGERKRRKSSRMRERQVLAATGVEAAYPIQVLGYQQCWLVLFSTDGISGCFAPGFPAPSPLSLWTIQPWARWERRSSLPWIFCSSIHFSVLRLSVQLILPQQAPTDERGVMALVLCCSPCSLYLLILSLLCFSPQSLKFWTS